MKSLFLMLSFFCITAVFAQDYSMETTWQVDSFAPINDVLDDKDLLMIVAMASMEEEDRTAFLKIEQRKISMLNPKKKY